MAMEWVDVRRRFNLLGNLGVGVVLVLGVRVWGRGSSSRNSRTQKNSKDKTRQDKTRPKNCCKSPVLLVYSHSHLILVLVT